MIFFIRRHFLALLAVLLASSLLDAKADLLSCGVDLGAAGRTKEWAVFSLGGGVRDDDFTGRVHIYGDVGAAGNGDVELSGNATIHGDLYYHTPGQLKKGKNAIITGMTHQDAASDALLDQAVIDANNASDQAWALSASSSVMKIDRSMTITGSGCVVLKITDFNLNNNETLTLTGTAGTAFIINVTKQFSLKDNAQIVLGPGIQSTDVLFNIRGTGGDAIVDNKAKFRGILMANRRTAKIQGDATVFGEVIANHIDIKHNAVIIRSQ